MSRRFAVAVAVALTVTAIGPSIGVSPAAATPGRPEDVPPSSKRVYVVADSVGLSARAAIPAAFPADWQVTVDGTAALFVEQLLSKHVATRRASTPWVFGDHAIVAAGYNYPYWDPARFDRSIDAMVSTLVAAGTKHVHWVTLREVLPQYVTPSAWAGAQQYNWYFPIVNAHLRRALDRHPQLSLVDWESIADQPGLTYDAIHLNAHGAREYAALASTIVQTAPSRRPAGTVSVLRAAGANGVPADVRAVAVNLTAVNPRTAGYLTVYPCGGTRPFVSNLNFLPGEIVATTAVVPVAADGTICVYQYADANVVVDLTGSFTATSGFAPLAPVRAIDTRETGAPATPTSAVVAPVGNQPGVGADRSSVVLNVTTVGRTAAGSLYVYPCDGPSPAVPTRTFLPGRIQNLLMVSAVDARGNVCVTATQPVDLVVDVFGSFAPGADVHPVLPTRLADEVVAPSTAIAREVPAATGAVINVNVTGAQGQGFVTAFPCAVERPFTSMLNTVPDLERGNSTIVAANAAAQVCVAPSFGARVTVDLTARLGAGFVPQAPVRLLDTREGQAIGG